MKFRRQESSRKQQPFAYFTIDEVAERLGVTREQVLRLGMSGDIIFSVLENEPSNYEEVFEHSDENGGVTVKTRTKITQVIMEPDEPPLKLRYIHPEDVIQTVINAAPSRKTRIHRLYHSRELLPGKGRFRINNPLRVDVDDLLVQREELDHFEQNYRDALRKRLPLQVPEKVTLAWLFRTLPWQHWLTAASLLIAAFFMGVQFAQTRLFADLTSQASSPTVTQN